MEKSINCLYCQRNDLQKSLMIEICDLSVSTLFLFKEQSHVGRCVVAYKNCKVAKTIQTVFSAKKINYGAYSDKLPHLHFHIVPKYEDAFEFGGIFEMNPQKIYFSDAENKQIIEKIVNAL